MKAFALAVLLLGQEPSLQNGVVSGQVLGLNGQPATGVRVVAMAEPAPGAPDAGFSLFESIVETDAAGRYRLEDMPPGRHIIAAGLIDSLTYYPGVKTAAEARAITVAAGETLDRIDFALANSAGVRVFGIASGAMPGIPVDIVRVIMAPVGAPRMARAIDAQVRPDGTFEFSKVPPGQYEVRLLPSIPSVQPIPIDVQDKDVGPLKLSGGIAISGRVLVEDGGELPTPKNAPPSLPTAPSLVALLARETVSSTIRPVQVSSKGEFLWVLPEGEYDLSTAFLPFGYRVKSMEYGNVNLLEDPLKVADPLENPSASIQITLTTTPLPGERMGARVSGHVPGIASGPSSTEFWIRLQTAGVEPNLTKGAALGIGEARIGDDGTFEVTSVPPGVYNAQIFPRGGPPISDGATIVVTDDDVTGAEMVAGFSPLSPPAATSPSLLLAPSAPGTGLLPSTEPRGVTVQGRVEMSFAGHYPDSVVLFGSQVGGNIFEAPVRKDGLFEIRNVPPGVYDARTLPLAVPPRSTRVLVESREIDDVRIPVPPLFEVRGRISIEEGSPTLEVDRLGVRLVSMDGSIEIPVAKGGTFAMKVNRGQYRVSVIRVPQNYVVRFAVQGTTDLSTGTYNTASTDEVHISIGAAR